MAGMEEAVERGRLGKGPCEDLGVCGRGEGTGPGEDLGVCGRGVGTAGEGAGPDTHDTQLRSQRFGEETPEMELGDVLVECPSQGQSPQHRAASGDLGRLRKRQRRLSVLSCLWLTLITTTILSTFPQRISGQDLSCREVNNLKSMKVHP